MIDLHSTMLLLYPLISITGQPFIFFIYIPLCFYFIVSRSAPNVDEKLYLHSTMLLLYPDNELLLAISAMNLHSTMLLLYPKDLDQADCTALFTFHYASTLSGMYVLSNKLKS